MPIKTTIDKSKDLTTFVVTGVLTYEKVMAAVEAFYAGETTKHVLWDLTETKENQLSLEQMDEVISFQPRFEGNRESGKTAIVAQDSLLWGLSRTIAKESNRLDALYTVMVFSTEGAAYPWFDEP